MVMDFIDLASGRTGPDGMFPLALETPGDGEITGIPSVMDGAQDIMILSMILSMVTPIMILSIALTMVIVITDTGIPTMDILTGM